MRQFSGSKNGAMFDLPWDTLRIFNLSQSLDERTVLCLDLPWDIENI